LKDSGEVEKLKTLRGVVNELNVGYTETLDNVKGFSKELRSARQLWKDSEKPKLIKLGLALIAFPGPPPFTEIAGAAAVSLGLIQSKMRNSKLHIEDVYKTFKEVLSSLGELKEGLL